MSVDSTLMMKQGINILALIEYIKEKYEDVDTSQLEDNFTTIYFKDGEDVRRLSVYVYQYDGYNEGYPAHMIAGKTCTLSLGKWGRSVEILTDIAEHFGGGFVQASDSAFAENGEGVWIPVFSNGNKVPTANETELKILSLIQKADKEELKNVDKLKLAQFIFNHLQEIKEI